LRASEIAAKAADLVGGDREKQHGDKVLNFQTIAEVWNGYLRGRRVNGKPDDLSAEDVSNLMESLKVARRLTGAYNPDDYIDGAGYAGVSGEIRHRQETSAKSWVDKQGLADSEKHRLNINPFPIRHEDEVDVHPRDLDEIGKGMGPRTPTLEELASKLNQAQAATANRMKTNAYELRNPAVITNGGRFRNF
jgi:hypothetical protein